MDFARTLERQLAALRARLDAAHAREDELVAIISSMDFSFERAQSDEVHENLDSALYRYAAAKEQRNKQ